MDYSRISSMESVKNLDNPSEIPNGFFGLFWRLLNILLGIRSVFSLVIPLEIPDGISPEFFWNISEDSSKSFQAQEF